MAILIIYHQLDEAKTGGMVYDFQFIKTLKKFCGNTRCDELVDASLSERLKGNLSYEIAYLKKRSQISKYNTIFTNSRLYPRLLGVFMFLNMFSKSRLIVFHHHFNFLTEKGFIKYIHKVAELLFLRMADIIVIPSPYIRDLMKKYCPRKQIAYLEIPFKTREAVCLPKENTIPQLLFVGTVEQRKGIIHLMEAANQLVQKNIKFHLTIAGNIPARSSYYQMVADYTQKNRLEEYITFTGRVSDEQLQTLYRQADIFVFPSLHEGYGIVLLEAMSYGLPVIAFDNSAMPYTIRDMGNGLLAKNTDSKDFATKIALLLSDKALYNQLAQGAADTYNNSHSLAQFENEVADFVKDNVENDNI